MSNKRKTPSENEKQILIAEVDGFCPICSIKLFYEKDEKTKQKYELAHIYPLNPTDIEAKVLDGVERLSTDSNHIDNFIALCRNCHKEFDHPRTLEGYNKMLNLKKKFIKTRKEKTLYSQFYLEENIKVILEKLVNYDEEIYIDIELEYNPKTIDLKLKKSVKPIFLRKIKKNVASSFPIIKTFLNDLEDEKTGAFDKIATNIKCYYLELRDDNSEEEVFYRLCDWLNKKTENISKEACELVISFFIQNCEVF